MKIRSINLLQILSRYLRILFGKSLLSLLEEQLIDNYLVLDVGCGRCSLLRNVEKPLYKVGLDFYEPYLIRSKLRPIHNCYVLGDVRRLPFKSKSFDCTTAIEIIEHLNKIDGLKMLKEMERVSRKRMILTTPNGFLFAPPGSEDNPEEKHVSGWMTKELRRLGFKVYGINGWRMLRGGRVAIKRNPNPVFTFFSLLTNSFIYHYPFFAFQLFCFKNVKDTYMIHDRKI